MSDLTENYKNVFDGRIGFGHSPIILVVDFVQGYTKPEYPLYAEDVVTAVAESQDIVRLARQHSIPVVFTRVVYHNNGFDGGLWVKKIPVLRSLTAEAPAAQFCESLQPEEGDVVITKQYASAFFGTSLSSMLAARRTDTIILIGCSTSGCIRATAVDGMQHGFRVIVPKECVGDRHSTPHTSALFDINSKYGDVLDKEEVLNYLEHIGVTR